ncbi:uncharacterized protein MONBRDRAFT_23559 [Monosiga brevicollis MX1]|uniref:tRNA (adenine(58)-N(1))-methyltransferase non-catalytic subunit TRM6 n=1 Tax=Monosiga brevicollis TaxID=81824 RepID=A9UTS9_MONBE|nr:uncharacterized protein MONBRDRAFT_23559 [Monosiga brevicollis MX1]EDQ91300.1 predicted protein [Monosiga brevicollis MX1]|eukprot:XP_001743722.1 hypothetical protein [Monosiga brevicollis MX1]
MVVLSALCPTLPHFGACLVDCVKRHVRMGKIRFNSKHLIGTAYGEFYRVDRDRLIPYVPEEDNDDEDAAVEGDNRGIIATKANQGLDDQAIQNLKSEGVTGEALVQTLVENSKTFKQKHAFTREKYIKRKKEIHVNAVQILRPTIRNLHDAFYQHFPDKIASIRVDTLASLLMRANVQPHSRVVVFETCSGLMTAAVARQLGAESKATIVPFSISELSTVLAQRQALVDRTEAIPDSDVPNMFEGHQRDRARAHVLLGQCDSLIVAARYRPTNIVQSLLKLLAPSQPFVVYHEYRELLVELMDEIKGASVNVNLAENFLRYYQVLEKRTHPLMTTEPRPGSLLYGTTTHRTATSCTRTLYERAVALHGPTSTQDSAAKAESGAPEAKRPCPA